MQSINPWWVCSINNHWTDLNWIEETVTDIIPSSSLFGIFDVCLYFHFNKDLSWILGLCIISDNEVKLRRGAFEENGKKPSLHSCWGLKQGTKPRLRGFWWLQAEWLTSSPGNGRMNHKSVFFFFFYKSVLKISPDHWTWMGRGVGGARR